MIGKTHTITLTVDISRLAKTVGSGELAVLATPMMIAAMERAASELLAQSLKAGETSVGTSIQVEHIAATPLGMQITATAAITGVEGRMVQFSVAAQDETGEIGRGTHTRVIVDAVRFQQKADAKRGAAE